MEKQIKDPDTIQGSGIITNTDNEIVTAPSVECNSTGF
ncbi:hypothetical protein ACTJIV_18010 [Chryseobacterium sp. 22532]